MYLVQLTYTRPNTNVKWYKKTAEFTNDWQTSCVQTKKVISEDWQDSPDGLRKTINVLWASKADHDAYCTSPAFVAHRTARIAYFTANGLTMSFTNTEL